MLKPALSSFSNSVYGSVATGGVSLILPDGRFGSFPQNLVQI